MFALNVFPLTVSSVRAASGRSLLESVDEDWEPLRVVAALLSPSSESVVILDIFPFSHAARHTFCFVLQSYRVEAEAGFFQQTDNEASPVQCKPVEYKIYILCKVSIVTKGSTLDIHY